MKFLPLSQVRLLSGPFKVRQEIHAQFLLGVDPDRLLAPFRIQAGLPPKAERYGGWESRDISGHSLGHYLSALSLMHASLGNRDMYQRAHYIVSELAACQQANGDGYVLPVDKHAFADLRKGRIEATPFSLNGVWVPFYTLHKVLAGLRDALHHTDCRQALAVARGLANWLDAQLSPLSPAQIQEILRTEHGGMNEVLADLSADAGAPRYLEMASAFFHDQRTLRPLLRCEDALNGLHGNTQIPKVIGLAREHELKPDHAQREAARFFWDRVVKHRSYVIGGHGESEHFFPPEQFPKRLTPNTCETCNTYNLLKLTSHLFTWEPDAAHMDFVERASINHLLANIGLKPGEFGYFLSLGSVGVKVFSTSHDSWWCCVGTGMENPARYGEQVCSIHERSVYINQYLACELSVSDFGLQLRQETAFPDSDTVRLRLSLVHPARFVLKFRHPWWCKRPELSLNGRVLDIASRPVSYFGLERDWQDGDELTLRLPMRLQVAELPYSKGRQIALLHGPSVLASVVPEEAGSPNPARERFSEHLQARGKTDAFPPHLVANSPEEVLAKLRPLSRFGEFESLDLLKPADLKLIPLHRIYEEPYAVYFPIMSAPDWQRCEAQLRQEQERQRSLDAATLDSIPPGYQQPEVEHALVEEGSEIEEFADRKARLARNGGYFSYELSVSPTEPCTLVITYWGGVWHKRIFDLFIDNIHLASESLLTNQPGEFFDQAYPIPPALSLGRNKLRLRFQARPADIAGGVFDVRVVLSNSAPSKHVQTFAFKDH